MIPSVVAPTCQMITAVLYLVPIVLFVDGTGAFVTYSWKTLFAITGLGAMGTASAFVLYYRILYSGGASAVAMGIYLAPIFGTLFGVIFMKEELGLHVYFAAALILLGMMTVNGHFRQPFLQKTS